MVKHHQLVDIEDFMNCSISNEQLLKMRNQKIFRGMTASNRLTLEKFTRKIASSNVNTKYKKVYGQLSKEFGMAPKKAHIFCVYRQLVENGEIEQNINLEQQLIAKKIRALSGVLVITVLTGPSQFSCPKDCHYCPNEPGQPRSYLMDEPAVKRANRNKFDPVRQFFDRAITHFVNGHPIDKIEIIVLGGTWSSYPHDYQEEFIRDLYYAANVFLSHTNVFRDRLSLNEEQKINETGKSRIIGLTLETRPDYITWTEIERFRKYGCTRVQLGIQHTESDILKKINRDCTTADAIRALTMLKDCGYKIDAHFMPDLPGSTPIKDWNMFKYVLESPDLQFDQWKIYPCEITSYTRIKEWYENGLYVPYSDTDETLLMNLIMLVKNSVHPWIRLNRVIRDIPLHYIIGGNQVPNLRQELGKIMKKNGLSCDCIRCREVRDNVNADPRNAVLYNRIYPSSGGQEYFLSFESNDRKIIFGFLRLRLSDSAGRIYSRSTGQNGNRKLRFPELDGCALVRELHVYGQLVTVGDSNKKATQHYGFGKRLLMAAEKIAIENGFRKMAIISGVGVKEYYRRHGYVSLKTYVVKVLDGCKSVDEIRTTNYTQTDGNIIVEKPVPYLLNYITPKKSNGLYKTLFFLIIFFALFYLLIILEG